MAAVLNEFVRYTGQRQPQPGELDERGRERKPYFPSTALVEAVNLAIYLRRPLLLKGEPGCGKTRLAAAVAWELGLPYDEWHVKSTSRARDGLFSYDAVGQLRDAQLAKVDRAARQRVAEAQNYVRLETLGRAFARHDRQTVLLIDEIDKADIDFPNDLLLELDELRFTIQETGKEVCADSEKPPILFITSNDEKDLPDPFLRRCVFHFVGLPDRQRLIDIVRANFPSAPPDPDEDANQSLVRRAVARFMELRQRMERDGAAGKLVSTSELLDWFRALAAVGDREALGLLQGRLPFPSLLLKNVEDERYLEDDGRG